VSYSLVLQPGRTGETERAVGDDVFLRDMSSQYRVFAFYYPSAMPDVELEKALRNLGNSAGNNLFVNIGRLDDPDFESIVRAFSIQTFPAVVMTATAELAAPPNEYLNAYVLIDNATLLADPARTTRLIEGIFSLFLRGEIEQAASQATWAQRTAGVRVLARKVVEGLRHLGGFVADRDWKVSVVEGRFEMTKSDS
jgi:hypothetical protein